MATEISSVKVSKEIVKELEKIKTENGLNSLQSAISHLLQFKKSASETKKANNWQSLCEQISAFAKEQNKAVTVRFLQSKAENGIAAIPRDFASNYVKSLKSKVVTVKVK